MAEVRWFFQSANGRSYILPQQMSFIGCDKCDIVLKSKAVDKQHAMLRHDADSNCFKIKDLGSENGTFLNNICLPAQVYITLKEGDSLRFGKDSPELFVEKKIVKIQNDAENKSSESSSSSSSSSSTSSSSLSSKSRTICSKLSSGIEKRIMQLNQSMEKSTKKNTEVEKWFSANAPKKSASKHTKNSSTDRASNSTTQKARLGTPVRDQVPSSHSSPHSAKPISQSSSTQKSVEVKKADGASKSTTQKTRLGTSLHDQIPSSNSSPYSPKAVSQSKSTQKSVEVKKAKHNSVEKHKGEDSDGNSSGKGTYTIEIDKESKDEREARKNIPEIFGITTVEVSKGKNKSTSSSSSSSKSSSSSESSTNITENLPFHKDTKNTNPENIRSSWVSEWVEQHQKSLNDVIFSSGEKPPSYDKCLSERMDASSNLKKSVKSSSVTSVSDSGRKSRRSLPQIPSYDVAKTGNEKTKQSTQPEITRVKHVVRTDSPAGKQDTQSLISKTSSAVEKSSRVQKSGEKSEAKFKTVRKLSDDSKKVKSDDKKMKRSSRSSSSSSSSSSSTSNQKKINDDRKKVKKSIEKNAINKTKTTLQEKKKHDKSSSSSSNSSVPSPITSEIKKTWDDKKVKTNERTSPSKKTKPPKKSTSEPYTSKSGKSEERKSTLIRSNTFTKEKPSGIVPSHDIPMIDSVEDVRPSSPFEPVPIKGATSTSLSMTSSFNTYVSPTKTKKNKRNDFGSMSSSYSSTTSSDLEIASNVSLNNGTSGKSRNKISPRKQLESTDSYIMQRPTTLKPSPYSSRKLTKQREQKELCDRLSKSNRRSDALRKSIDSDNELNIKNVSNSTSTSPTLDTTTSGLRLNRATLLRKNKAKQMASCATSNTRLTPTLDESRKSRSKSRKSIDKTSANLNSSSQQRLSDLSRPPARRLRKISGTETSESNRQKTPTRGLSATHRLSLPGTCKFLPNKLQNSVTSTSYVTETSDTVFSHRASPTTPHTEVSLGAQIAHVADRSAENISTVDDDVFSYNDKQPAAFHKKKYMRRSTSLDRKTYRGERNARLSSRHKQLTGYRASFSDYTSVSEDDDQIFLSPRQRKMLEERESTTTSTSFDANNNRVIRFGYNSHQSTPDGETSQEIAKVSQDLVKDLEILSKSMDEIDVSTTASEKSAFGRQLSNGRYVREALPTDSLDSLNTAGNFDHFNKLVDAQYSMQYKTSQNSLQFLNTAQSLLKVSSSPTVLESPTKSNRRTWAMGVEPLDSLALSNAVFLSKKLDSMANRIQSKMKITLGNSCGNQCRCQLCQETPSESKFSSNSSDVPLLQQTSSQEMASLINNLRHIECVLKEIEWHVDSGHPSQDLH